MKDVAAAEPRPSLRSERATHRRGRQCNCHPNTRHPNTRRAAISPERYTSQRVEHEIVDFHRGALLEKVDADQ
jgi:hypothetical protein